MANKFCQTCGNPLGENERFCGKCGTPAQEAPSAAPEAAAPVNDAAMQATMYAGAPEAPVQAVPEAPIPEEAVQQAAQFAGAAEAAAAQTAEQAAAFASNEPVPGYPVTDSAPVPGAVPPAVPQAPAPKKSGGGVAAIAKYKVPIIIAAAVLVLGIAGFIVFKQLTKWQKIDAKELFVVEFTGLNGDGKASYYLNCEECDPHRWESDYSYDDDDESEDDEDDEFGGSSKKKGKEYSDYLSDDAKTLQKAFDKAGSKSQAKKMRKALMATSKDEYKLKIKFDTEEGLSNGDTVTCTVEYDEDDLKDVNIKLENTEFEVEVTGLIEAEEIDMFDGFEIKFTGINEYGEVSFPGENEKYPFIGYSDATYGYNLKNGDTYSIEAYLRSNYVDDQEYLYDDDGNLICTYFNYEDKAYQLKTTSVTRDFTVSGLEEPQEIDVFEGVKLNTTGALPYLIIDYSLNTEACPDIVKDNVSFSVERDQDFYKAGDKITISAYVYSSFREAGYKPAGTPDGDGYYYKEFTIEDDGSYGRYILDDADADTHKKLDEAENSFNAIVAEFEEDYLGSTYISGIEFGDGITKFSEAEPFKGYLVKCNGFDEGTISTYDDKTYIVKVYKITATYEEGDETKERAFFLATRVKDALVNANGEIETGSTSYWAFGTKINDVVTDILSYTDEGTRTELTVF